MADEGCAAGTPQDSAHDEAAARAISNWEIMCARALACVAGAHGSVVASVLGSLAAREGLEKREGWGAGEGDCDGDGASGAPEEHSAAFSLRLRLVAQGSNGPSAAPTPPRLRAP